MIATRLRHLLRGPAMPALLLTFILTVAADDAAAVIVNSLRGFETEKAGWAVGLGGSYSASGGNSESSSLGADARLQWLGSRDTWRLLGAAKRATSDNLVTARAVLGHLRHNHRLSDHLYTLAFLQLQENPFQRLKSRFLTGAGLRWDPRPGVSIGCSDMLEREHIRDETGTETHQRMSTFLSLMINLRQGVRLDAVSFYQPRWSDFEDWRVFANLGLDVKLGDHLSLFTGLDLERDSRPPADVKKTDWETATGLRISF